MKFWFLLMLLQLARMVSMGQAIECYLCDDCPAPIFKKTDKIICDRNQGCLKAVINFTNDSVTFRACQNIDPLSRLPLTGHLDLPIRESHFYFCTSQLCNGSSLNQFHIRPAIQLSIISLIMTINLFS